MAGLAHGQDLVGRGSSKDALPEPGWSVRSDGQTHRDSVYRPVPTHLTLRERQS